MQHNTQPRRQDRAVNDQDWIKEFLNRAPYGVLATANNGQPYAKPNLFVYDPTAHVIYLHGANEGRTLDTLKENPQICFTAAEIGRLLPAENPRGLSVEFASVVVFGRVHILVEEDEMLHGLQLLIDKYFPRQRSTSSYTPLEYNDLPGTSVYRIEIQAWSGKQKQERADFPGAFKYKV